MPSLTPVGIGRQPEILQHHRRLEAPQLRQRFGARRGHQHFVFVEAPLELLLQALDRLRRSGALVFLRTYWQPNTELVPRPGVLHTSTSPPSARAYSRTW